ncbi:MAG: TonB-dependent receptor [Chlorobi bacterium]|nr:TonB-dependent receptor [Chlorobiota bacterium]
MYKKFITISIFLFSAFYCFSQNDTTEVGELVNYSIEELLNLKISSVSKNEEKLTKAPQFVTVITGQEIIERGYIDLEQVLHDFAGFDISRGNGTQYSQIYQRGYRSNNTDRTLLLIDGVEENDLWSGSVWLSRQYPLSNIERIEIIYGPASTLYGANAFVGVINIITKDPAKTLKQNTKFNLNGIANYGSWNTKFFDATITSRINKAFIMLTGRIYKSDEMNLSKYNDWDYDLSGYDVNYYSRILDTNDLSIINTAIELDNQAFYNDSVLNGVKPHYSNSTKDWLINGKMKIENFTIGLQMWQRNEGYGAWYRDDYELGTDFGGKWVPKNSFFYINYTKKFSDKFTLTNLTRYKIHQLKGSCEEFYYKGYLNQIFTLTDLLDSTGNLSSNPVQPYWLHSFWYVYSQQVRSELTAVYSPISKIDIISGFEFRRSLIQGEYITSLVENPSETGINPGTIGGNYFPGFDIGVYSQFNWHIVENFDFVAGGRLDYNRVRETGGYGAVFNPKLAIIYGKKALNFKLIYSEAFKDAENWVKYGTTPGRLLNNPYLVPERVNNIEANLGMKINDRIYASFTAYQANYSNVIGTVDVNYVDEEGRTIETTQHQSTGSLVIQGFQTDMKAKFGNYSSYINYTFTNPQNTGRDTLVRIGDIASHKLNFGINAVLFDNLNVNARFNYMGKRKTGKNTTIKNNPLDYIDPYFIANMAITYRFISSVKLQLSVNNLFNSEYFHPGVRSANGSYYAAKMPQNERNFMIKIIFALP